MLKLLADQNFNEDILRGLLLRNPDLDIVRVRDVGLSEVDDPNILIKGESCMRYELYKEVFLLQDIPEKGLKQGDVATIVEHHPVIDGEDGYSLEVFNVFGDTIAVITVPESAIAPLAAHNIFSVRSLAA